MALMVNNSQAWIFISTGNLLSTSVPPLSATREGLRTQITGSVSTQNTILFKTSGGRLNIVVGLLQPIVALTLTLLGFHNISWFFRRPVFLNCTCKIFEIIQGPPKLKPAKKQSNQNLNAESITKRNTTSLGSFGHTCARDASLGCDTEIFWCFADRASQYNLSN